MRDSILHITNGDVAAALIRESGLGGDVLPWRDVLHDGPVPGGHRLEALSDLRAGFLARQTRLALAKIRDGMATRDATLRDAGAFAEIVLWFEHDLYDQLQILQILDTLAADAAVRGETFLICIDRFPGVEPFHGLGQLNPDQVAGLWPERQPVGESAFSLAQTGWRAFTSDTPHALNDLLGAETKALPFLGAAISRLLAEYPSRRDGLSRTEQTIADMVSEGIAAPDALFREHQAREPAPFLGDWSFWDRVAGLCGGPAPLLAETTTGIFNHPPRDGREGFDRQRLALTDAGRRVRGGEADAVALNGIDRWIGGVHLQTAANVWRFDPEAGRIVP